MLLTLFIIQLRAESVPQMLIGLQLNRNASEDLTLLHLRQTVVENPGNPCLAQDFRVYLVTLPFNKSTLIGCLIYWAE